MDTGYLDPGWFLVVSHAICAFAGPGAGCGLLRRMPTCLRSQQAEGICEEQHFAKEEGDCVVLRGALFKTHLVRFVCR